MSGQDLYLQLQSRVALLDSAMKQIALRGQKFAQAEHHYRVALAQKILIERDKGTPVTIISDLCRGDKKVARLKFDRDCAESLYKAGLEACNVQKLQLRLLENQIDREYRG